LLAGLFCFEIGKREVNERVWGYLYLLSQKLAVGRRISGYSGYMSGYSGHSGLETLVPEKLQMSNSYSETPSYCPDTPDHNVRIFQTLYRTFRINMDFHKKTIFSGRFDSNGFCRFYLSTTTMSIHVDQSPS
jgi:hypothetical protein